MAARGRNIQLYKGILRHLQSIYKKDKLKDTPAYLYFVDQFRKHQVTGEKHCRAKEELHHLGETYLCLLDSIQKYEELSAVYKGQGERTVESSANLVGLRLPQVPPPPSENM
ncbi:hypothetical protein CHS0354_024281 [Potamilus streckersoni]|uniref:Protein FMC1 homolog n=1 Tax=Potamilus streckersoni TaxID=2493646 RepID=A0AAE0VTG1_9BIVA|nr:hypothetical protein CHS0354_024281 [Potamilus streckersoni]